MYNQSMKANTLQFLVGKDISGNDAVGDFVATGNFISAGHTGSGHASYDEAAFVTDIMHRYSPDEVKFVMIDPKQVQLTPYEGSPYLLMPVIYTPEAGEAAITKLLEEASRRQALFAEADTVNITEYNETAAETLPRIILLGTEIADLMMVNGPLYQNAFLTLAQQAQVTGIHLYIATQRPSADVLPDELLEAIDGRLVFAVANEVDSMRLLGRPDAHNFVEAGVLIYGNRSTGMYTTIKANYVSDEEVARLTGTL